MNVRGRSAVPGLVLAAVMVAVVCPVLSWRWGPWQRAPRVTVTLPQPNAFERYLQAERALPAGFASLKAAAPLPVGDARRALVAACGPSLALLRGGFAYRCGLPVRTPLARALGEDWPVRCGDALRLERDLQAAEGHAADAVRAALDVARFEADLYGHTALPPGMAKHEPFDLAAPVDGLTAAEARNSLARLATVLSGVDRTFGEALARDAARRTSDLAATLSQRDASAELILLALPSTAEILAPDFDPLRPVPRVRGRWLQVRLADWLGLERGPLWRQWLADRERIAAWAAAPYGTVLTLPQCEGRAPDWTAGYLEAMRRQWLEARAGQRLLVAALAVRAWTAEHGAPPESLRQLCPGLLSGVPRDPFDEQPLRYRLVDGRPRLWSIGPDNRDDGGRPIRGGRYDKSQETLVGGRKVPIGDRVWGASAVELRHFNK